MEGFRELLLRSEALLLFLVIGLGFLFGEIKIRGFKLGIAGVLFVGLAFGAWRPAGTEPLVLAPALTEIGLILFVYAVGLTSGAGFFASLRQRGLRFNLAVIISLSVAALVTLILGRLMGLTPGLIAGVYCGGLTNTPALAAVSELLKSVDPAHASDPALAYSVSYPFGVLGGLLSYQIFMWIHRARFKEEVEKVSAASGGGHKVTSMNFEVTNPDLVGRAIGELRVQEVTGCVISRIRHNDDVDVPTKYTLLQKGDVIVAVGRLADLQKATAYFGAQSQEHLEHDRQEIEVRRVLLSNKSLVGKTIEELDLDRRFNAQVTRLRRADVDLVATPDMTLELGDRLRLVMPRERVGEVSKYFGDSEKDVAELDYVAITLGITLGVLIGMIPIPLPGGNHVALGIAGGPLVIGLILGKIGRTGPVVWMMPLEANHAIRHFGLLFFLAGVGVLAGGRFLHAMASNGLQLFALGAIVTALTMAMCMALLRRIGHSSYIATLGATSGLQTQPATLARAYQLTRADEVYVAYATTYPVGMIGKILLAQLILLAARWLG